MKFYTHFHMRGDSVIVRGYEDGKRFQDNINYKPTLYVPSKTGDNDMQTIDGEPLSAIQLGSIRDARDFVQRYKEVEGFKIYGSTQFDSVYVNEWYSTDYDPDLVNIANIDIEVQSDEGFPDQYRADHQVLSIAISNKGKMYVLGIGDYTPKQDNVIYHDCLDERRLLHTFLRLWRKLDPDIVTGWNVLFFDIPYLVNRIRKVLGDKEAKMLSPNNFIKEKVLRLAYGEQTEYDLVGISILDYLELYKKFTYSQQESYKLDHIAFVELGERKLDYSEVENLHQLYKADYEKFIDYNIKDVELIDKLEAKMKLLDMALAIAYDGKVNYREIFTQVRMWDTLIHNNLYDKGIAIPPKTENIKTKAYSGAFVKEPQVGMHKWIMSFDLNSLYPHLIMQYNISPDTLVEDEYRDVRIDDLIKAEAKNDNEEFAMAANGRFFRKDKQGFLPAMMERMYNERVIAKKSMLEAQSKLEEVNRRLKNG